MAAKLWIDDIRVAPEGWLWAKSSKEALAMLNDPKLIIDEISFDHDLGGDDTTIPVAEFLEEIAYERQDTFPWVKWHIHSANPIGARNLRRILEQMDKYMRARY